MTARDLTEAELLEAYRGTYPENDLLEAITATASYRGWRWHHVRRSDRALQMGHPGFPDLVLIRPPDGLLFLELKSAGGRVHPDQEAWINDLARIPGARAMVARPADLDTILELLK